MAKPRALGIMTIDRPPPRPAARRFGQRRSFSARVAVLAITLSTAFAAVGCHSSSLFAHASHSPSKLSHTTNSPRSTATAGTVPQAESGSAGPSPNKQRWKPRAGLSWQWQLSVPVDQSVNVDVYDIDMFENDANVVALLHAAGRKVICYVDVGSYEKFRPDISKFPKSVLGKSNGWPGERWLDIRQVDVLRPIMAARFDLCAQRGFDGVEPDLMDGYASDTGFPITASDQLKYNLMIAGLGHERGLAVGLKNDLTQIPELVGHVEFAVNEQCAEYSECQTLIPFIAAGKPVFHTEYNLPKSAFCEQTTSLGFSSMLKKPDLGSWRDPC